jgi:hypothetical protein
MANPMRGHQIELPIRGDCVELLEAMEHKGFLRNNFLIHLANAAAVFAKEEDDRIAASLECEIWPTDLVVFREFADWHGRSSWVSMRKSRDQWFLSAILFDDV